MLMTPDRARRLLTLAKREVARRRALGGPGSGNFGHSGRPGHVGGSSSESGAEAVKREHERQTELAARQTNPLANPKAVLGARDTQATRRYVAAYGEEFKSAPLPDGVEKGPDRECYRNASLLVMTHPEYDYAEGFAKVEELPELTFMHAWAVTKDGTVVDPTWRKPEMSQYFGVRYDRAAYLKYLYRAEIYGVLGSTEKNARRATDTGVPELRRGLKILGGPGSGNFGHAGRPGEVGGSAPSDFQSAEAARLADAMERAVGEISSERLRGGLTNTTYAQRGLVKKAVVNSLTPTFASELARRDVAMEEGFIQTPQGMMTPATYVNANLNLWAETSGDSDNEAIRMQLAVEREFALKDAATEHFEWPMSVEVDADHNASARQAFVRAEYNETQRWFAERGITHVSVYRGMALGKEDADKLRRESGPISMQPASSWTTDIRVARGFAKETSSTTYRQALLFSTRVPVSRILSTSLTGRGCLKEAEVLMLGGTLNAKVEPVSMDRNYIDD